MQRSRWWDWSAVAILFFMVETVASRLVATNWTSFLFIAQTVAYIGFTIGAILGYTRFSVRLARWLSFVYMLVMLPLQWTLVIDQNTSLEEQLSSLAGRLYFSGTDLFARRPLEDPLLFVSLVTLGFGFIGTSAGFQLVRRQKYLAAVVPSAIVLLVIQSYDNAIEGRIWILAFYAFLALLLLGRLNHLENERSWRERRIFLSSDNSIDLTGIMAVAAALIVIFSWTPPASLSSFDSAIRTWNKLTRPWNDFTERMQDVVNPLTSPSGGKRGEFFGSEIRLGRGFPLSDSVVFRVQTPDIPTDQKPPRYYWRGRTYDYFVDDQWYTTGTSQTKYSPAEYLSVTSGINPARFIFNTGDETFSLIYSPPQAGWVSRQGITFNQVVGSDVEVVAWFASPALLAGETYQVDARLNNPDINQLSEAGTNYPAGILEKYLQLPENFSPHIADLARIVTADAPTPFDKTVAITTYLRDNIEYAEALPSPPRDRDTLEWVLFEYKKAYCVYYSSSEILMLRSLGIPARLAVGFSQGERDGDEYIVRKYDAHAWPEVYFPGIGWVEFEPTGSQPALNRPLPPSDTENDDRPTNITPENDINTRDLAGLQEGEEDIAIPEQVDVQPLNPSRYLIPLFILFATLTIFLGRRYSVPERIPVLLRVTYERSGLQTPTWIVNWEQWTTISSIERAFESVNFGLRLLHKPMPVYATPIERTKQLTKLLPKMRIEIKALLDEHQTSLYTSRQADVIRARRAAFKIRIHALLERIRYMLEGRPIENP